MMLRLLGIFLLLIALLAPAGSKAYAAEENFYQGKTITIVVGTTAGGGYDAYARLLGKYFPKYIPGNPSIITQYMPGAGTLNSVRYLDATAPKDGTVIVTFNPGLITQSIVNPGALKVNFKNFYFLGSIARDLRACYAWKNTGIKTWNDMMSRKEFLLGATARNASNYVNAMILKEIFGAPIRQILGYPGSSELRLAVERGELEGDCGSWVSVPKNWIADHDIIPFVKLSDIDIDGIPSDVPYIGALAKTQDQKDLLEVMLAAGELGRPFILSRKVPESRVAVLRKAFGQTMHDQGLIKDAATMDIPLSPVMSKDAEEIISRIANAPPDAVKKAKAILD
jgi:hypothetical protein